MCLVNPCGNCFQAKCFDMLTSTSCPSPPHWYGYVLICATTPEEIFGVLPPFQKIEAQCRFRLRWLHCCFTRNNPPTQAVFRKMQGTVLNPARCAREVREPNIRAVLPSFITYVRIKGGSLKACRDAAVWLSATSPWDERAGGKGRRLS
jgi:hypothetical protein